MLDDTGFELEAIASDNPELFAKVADQEAGQLSHFSFSDFLQKHRQEIIKPREPNRVCRADDPPQARMIYADAERRIFQDYEAKKRTYEQQKQEQISVRKYPDNWAGYGEYVAYFFPHTHKFFSRRFKLPVSEAQRRMHTYITGMTGSGKSEAIKTIIYHYITRNTYPSLVLLSPSKEIMLEVAKFPENLRNNRLIYICAKFKEGLYPCLNPFDIPDKESANNEQIERYAQEFILVFQEILAEKLTNHMANILNKTLTVLLRMNDTSVYDLLDFLDPSGERAQIYIEYAKENFSNPVLLNFFEHSFLTDRAYIVTKSSLHARLQLIFGSTVMQGVMIGKRTIDLEKEINAGKIVIFDLSKDDLATEWETLGKFVIAYLKLIAFRRANTKARPCHLFIDECHNYVTDSIEEILREARKYGLHLTLAQQTAGEKMSKDLKNAVLQNTAIKLTGMGAPDSLELIARQTGASVESLSKLQRGKFSLWKKALDNEEQKPPFVVTMPTNTLGHRHSMSELEWESLKNAQIGAYYRPPQLYTPRTSNPPPIAQKTGNGGDNTRQPEAPTNTGAQLDDMDISSYWN